MKRFLAIALALLLCISLAGCKKKTVLPLPDFHYYETTYGGRTYTTNGLPFYYEAEDAASGFLAGKNQLLGTAEELGGTFPANTRFYSINGASETVEILAVMEDGYHYFLVTSYDTVKIRNGDDILRVIGLENNLASLYGYNQKKTAMYALPLNAMEIDQFNTAYLEGGLIAPSGESVELVAKSFTGVIARFTLYENGAIVFEGCPQVAVDLGEETAAVLWNAIR